MGWIKRLFLNGAEGTAPELSLRARKALQRERLWVAKEVYDGPMQELADLIMVLGFHSQQAQSSRHPEMQEIGRRLEGLSEMGVDILRSMRECLASDSTAEKKELDLRVALREETTYLANRTGLHIQLGVSGVYRSLPYEQALAFCRIMREALINVYKHAEARHAWVQLDFGNTTICLSIRDDGRGFDLTSALRRGMHMGLKTMQESAELVGGRCIVESQPDRGTTVRFILPLIPSDSSLPPEASMVEDRLAQILEKRQLPHPTNGELLLPERGE